MTSKKWIILCIVLVAVALLAATVLASPLAQLSDRRPSLDTQSALGTGFTYQGQLKGSDGPITENCDMVFRLYDQGGTGGSQIGSAITTTVPITKGLFTVVLNSGGEFGSTAFTGDARWLGISVKCQSDVSYADLGRQELTAAPYALYALDADKLDGQEGGYYQARVDGECAMGSTIRAVNADGTVVCQSDAPLNRSNAPATNSITILDSADDVGMAASVTIGADGLGLISYFDDTHRSLKVAHCEDVACTSAISTTLDSDGEVGYFTSVVIGADGLGLIAYSDLTNLALKVAHCENIACTSATTSTIDSSGNGGEYPSIAIGADGLGLISYNDWANKELEVAHCDDVACTSATLSTIDSKGNVGAYSSVAIGADGLGLISYQDYTSYNLMVAHCSNVTCTSAVTTTLDSVGNVGTYGTSMVIGIDGLGLISYAYLDAGNWDLRTAHCDDITCTNAVTTTLYSAGNAGAFSSVTIGADGLGLISYGDEGTFSLKVAHCENVACTSASAITLDSASRPSWTTSATIGVDGMPLISYYDVTSDNLMVAHCSSPFCVPYFRRR